MLHRATLLTGLDLDEVFLRTDANGTRIPLPDGLNSTLALTDPNGANETSYTYEPFGTATFTGTPSANPFQYTGRENDGTGLYYYRTRYYHPTLQRFISEDPIGFDGGINVYAYVENNPLLFADPLGLDKRPQCSVPPPSPYCGDFYCDANGNPDTSRPHGIPSALPDPIFDFLSVRSAQFVPSAPLVRAKWLGLHTDIHPFPIIGKRPHYQFLWYLKHVKYSHWNWRFPLPPWWPGCK